MADMTLEKAKAILATTRKSKLQRLDTDLRIARHRYASHDGSHSGFLIGLAFQVSRAISDQSPLFPFEMILIMVLALSAIITGLLKRRYAKILRLFEDAAPQNIEDILALKNAR